MNTFSFLLSAILFATSTKHGRFQKWEFVPLKDASSPPASALSENGNLPVRGNASSPPMKTHAASSLDSLTRALANFGVNDPLSCADELRTLLTNRTRTENDISIAPWSYLRAFRDFNSSFGEPSFSTFLGGKFVQKRFLCFVKVARTSCAAQPERKQKWRPFSMETATHSDSLAARSTCRRTLTSTEEPKFVKPKGLSSRSVDEQTVTSFS